MMLPTGIKNQGSIGGGIAMIVIGAVISTAGIFVAWYVISTHSTSILLVPVSFFFLISIASVACGVVTLVKGINGYVHVHTHDGAIAITESNCPHQDCVKMGYVNTSNRPIVCAYNGVYITIEGGSMPNDVEI